MKGLPPELIYVLIFAAIILFQFMMKQLGQKVRQEQQEQQEEQEQQESMPEEFLGRTYEETAETAAPQSVPRPGVGHFGRTEAPKAVTAPARRRFSRKSLMGNKREVQNAIVIATIIGPCRAFEPYDEG